ncbi:hypothetical protein GCM10023187_17710 [Nibrella viscosa]|uniref:Oxygen sensor histidine kinase NreB n=2 Tax=Nibrella viscosa TaxID=1084524 RepID=A0ABP8K912_9BACT
MAQRAPLPELNFDRRTDKGYLDSLKTVGLNYLKSVDGLPRAVLNDSLKLEGLRYMALVYKQVRGPARDSLHYYANKLVSQSVAYNDRVYAVRGLMLDEYYFRVFKGDYPKALQINQRASELCVGLPKETSPLWQVHMNMGDIHLLLKEYNPALQSYEKSLALLPLNTLVKERNRKLLISQVVSQMGEVYDIQKRYDEARTRFEDARTIAYQTNSQTNIAYTSQRLGEFFMARRQPEQATHCYEEALAIWTRLGDIPGQASVFSRLAEGYLQLNQLDKAIDYGEKSLQIARQRESKRLLQMATSALYQVYRAAGKPDKALALYEEFVAVRDSLTSHKRIDEIIAIQKRYDIEKVQAEAEKQQLLQRQQLMNIRRQAELDQLKAKVEAEQLAAVVRETQLKQRIEANRLRAANEKTRLENRARIDFLNQNLEQQKLSRQFLLVGLFMLLAFLAVFIRKSRQIAHQKKQIEALNHGLEDKVRERTAELEAANHLLLTKNREIEEALLRGQTAERRRVAADLHDNLGGILSAIKMSLSALNPGRLTDREQHIYENLMHMTKEAYAEVRYLSHNLQPDELEKQGLAKALLRLTDKLNITHLTRFKLDTASLPTLDKNTEFQLYSICLELCNNILKHADATEAEISFRQIGSELTMIVRDNGRGMTTTESPGMGLQNIQERTEAVNGRLEIVSETGTGTTFLFMLPLSSDMAVV